MSTSSSSSSSGGIGAMGLLGVVFVTLKLLDKIDWSWWWVLAPFWVPTAIVLCIFLPVMIGALASVLKKPNKKIDRG